MRTVKKVSALVLTVMLLMSIMVLPASATTCNPVYGWKLYGCCSCRPEIPDGL